MKILSFHLFSNHWNDIFAKNKLLTNSNYMQKDWSWIPCQIFPENTILYRRSPYYERIIINSICRLLFSGRLAILVASHAKLPRKYYSLKMILRTRKTQFYNTSWNFLRWNPLKINKFQVVQKKFHCLKCSSEPLEITFGNNSEHFFGPSANNTVKL